MKKITLAELEKGCAAFWKNESRDAMYRIACKLVRDGWGNPADMADGLGVVLLTWNQAAYRYGSFSFDALEQFLKESKSVLESFRERKIKTFDATKDAATVKALFDGALDALAFTARKRKTPVGAAKALHILAPEFFPLWDQKIAKGCNCNWHKPERAADEYIAFMGHAQAAIESLEAQFTEGEGQTGLAAVRNLAGFLSKRAGRPKTMLKLLDEYLYAKYTKAWI